MSEAVSIQETPEEKSEKAAQQEAEGLILGKYKSQEDLVNAYKTLESKLGEQGNEMRTLKEALEKLNAGSKESPEAKPEGSPKEEVKDETPKPSPVDAIKAIAQRVVSEGLDAIPEDMAGTSGLDAGAEEQLVQAEIDRQILEQRYNEANQQATVAAMASIVGGEEVLKQISDFIDATYDDAQRAKVEAAAKDPATMRMTLKGLMAEAGVNGDTRKHSGPIQGERKPSAEAGGFASREDYHAALRDPKYQSDPVYKRKVDAQLRKSKWVGKDWRSFTA